MIAGLAFNCAIGSLRRPGQAVDDDPCQHRAQKPNDAAHDSVEASVNAIERFRDFPVAFGAYFFVTLETFLEDRGFQDGIE